MVVQIDGVLILFLWHGDNNKKKMYKIYKNIYHSNII